MLKHIQPNGWGFQSFPWTLESDPAVLPSWFKCPLLRTTVSGIRATTSSSLVTRDPAHYLPPKVSADTWRRVSLRYSAKHVDRPSLPDAGVQNDVKRENGKHGKAGNSTRFPSDDSQLILSAALNLIPRLLTMNIHPTRAFNIQSKVQQQADTPLSYSQQSAYV